MPDKIDLIDCGSQGCIFAPALIKPNTNSKKKVSKIFYNRTVRNRERNILTDIDTRLEESPYKNAVVDINFSYNLSNSNIQKVKNALKPIKNTGSAKYTINESTRLYGIDQSMVMGDIRKLPNKSKSLSFFNNAYMALIELNTKGYVHLDMAERNIFYTDEKAVIGDFGYGLDLSDLRELSHEEIMKQLENPRQDGYKEATAAFITTDRMTPEACLCIQIYTCWDEQDKVNYMIDNFNTLDKLNLDFNIYEHPNYEILFSKIVSVFDTLKAIDYDSTSAAKREKFFDYMIEILRRSDRKMYVRTILNKIADLNDEEKSILLEQVWVFDNLKSSLTNIIDEYRSIHITENNVNKYLNSLPNGGKRKTRMKRRKRIQTYRRTHFRSSLN